MVQFGIITSNMAGPMTRFWMARSLGIRPTTNSAARTVQSQGRRPVIVLARMEQFAFTALGREQDKLTLFGVRCLRNGVTLVRLNATRVDRSECRSVRKLPLQRHLLGPQDDTRILNPVRFTAAQVDEDKTIDFLFLNV